ncbi:predicted protein [Uncinocarpus reesii 1704]|uniref:DUF1746 domain-containing protein n=1 Tax=Uncinocarpus reesii (strain UAMH 1704) TaxID=336963 RepID=C4JZR6_UNCRE|nr:uncharacterized protein UREG_07667 [Uncinocarpus reesii 1704]EEP82802.1 predicted protein [Uncinocarpus reesii 1704]
MTAPVPQDAEYIADVSNFSHDNEDDDPLTPQLLDSRLRRRKEVRAKAKTVFLDRLLRDFDLLIYCQLSSLYYMDCSIINFAIRAVVQFAFFTPKSGFEPPRDQPFIGVIATTNILCILLHCLSSSPSAGEVSRGYLHGGLFIDFIGQKGPIPKLRLITLDVLVTILQIVMMGAILEKWKMKSLLPGESVGSTSPSAETSAPQDLDFEERGVRRAEEHAPSPDGIELQHLQPLDSQNDSFANEENDERDNERGGLLSGSAAESRTHLDRDIHPRDELLTGDITIMELRVFQTLRDQWNQNPPGNPPESTNSTTEISPHIYLRRRFGVHFGTHL